jgi:aryl-alcohol dehydrogenase-like predicted oxidoreductase
MEKRRIGSLEASVVGLGCNNFGGRLDAEATERVVLAALDEGINFFDTADVYGGTKSEEYLGQALKKRRDEAIIATKFGIKLDDERPGGGSPEYVRQACDDSLKRLGIDCIDLLQIHRPDSETPIADTLEALNELVKAGKIREIGCSNFSPEQLSEADAAANGGAKFVSVQNQYSLLHREPERGVLAECERLGQGFLPYFPLASGLLTGKHRKNRPSPEGTRLSGDRGQGFLSEENFDRTEALIRFAEERGHTILELAFSWLLAQPVVASVIAGATKTEQVKANVAAASWSLSEAELAEIDQIAPLS